MSPAPAAPAVATVPPAGTGTGGGRVRRPRRWVWPAVVTAGIVTVGLTTALLTPQTTKGDLDPGSAEPGGSRALARILGDHGVDVRRTSRSDETVDGAGRDTTVLVLRPLLLGPTQLKRLQDSRADLVLLEPDLTVLDVLAPGVLPAGVVDPVEADPGCDDPDARAAGRAAAGGNGYRLANGAVAQLCYSAGTPPAAAVVRIGRFGGGRVTVLGRRAILTNEALADSGNAALAIRVLGAHRDLRWYDPDPAELVENGEQPSVADLLPRWVPWVLVQLGGAAVLAFLWRGRRLGPVATEPLPVVVRAAETDEGRARLYRSGKARDRAAAVLRTATLRRLAHRLGIGAHGDPADVVRLAAAAGGRPEREVDHLLLGPAPSRDADLVALAGGLDALERALSGPSTGTTPRSGPRSAPSGEDQPA